MRMHPCNQVMWAQKAGRAPCREPKPPPEPDDMWSPMEGKPPKPPPSCVGLRGPWSGITSSGSNRKLPCCCTQAQAPLSMRRSAAHHVSDRALPGQQNNILFHLTYHLISLFTLSQFMSLILAMQPITKRYGSYHSCLPFRYHAEHV